MERLYKVHEAAKLLGITPAWLRELNAAGKIACIRLGDGTRLFTESEVKKFQKAREARQKQVA